MSRAPDVTVAAVLRSGGGYRERDAARLYRAVSRWAGKGQPKIRWEFRLLTDVDVPGLTCLPLTENWPGWWSKMELFQPGLLTGPVLYLDLDTLIVGDLHELLELPAYVDAPASLEDFYAPGRRASGVIAWDADRHRAEMAEYWNRVRADADGLQRQHNRRMDTFLGEAFMAEDPIQRMLPRQVVSFKVHCALGVPPDARVVCFHGRPRLNELPKGNELRRLWEWEG